MATSLFLLLDDLASMLDDVAVMTKVAAGKTAGVLGDDLALNAEQVAGVVAERELPVVYAVAKGSLINKAILVPAAIAISAVIPWAITPLLMCGGSFLCFEGFEKLVHKFFHPAESSSESVKLEHEVKSPAFDRVAFENSKIKGAIRTDFILSAEIIVISLGTVAAATLMQQITVLVVVAILMTIGVYGLVAGIVKLDDLGAYLLRQSGAFPKALGRGLLIFAPVLMKALSNLGMLAMFLVGGGILAHGIHPVETLVHGFVEQGGISATLMPMVINFVIGLLAGAILLAVFEGIKRLKGKFSASA